jgi:TonB family protein
MMKFRIIEHRGELSAETVNGKVWRKELNLVSWNNKPPKYEIRKWDTDHTVHGEGGIVFSYEEGLTLSTILNDDIKNRKLLRDSLDNKVPLAFPRTKATDIQAYLVEKIGVFSERGDRVRKEVNLMCWGDLEVKYDLRKWNDDNSPYYRRGIRLTKEEATVLVRLINDIKAGSTKPNPSIKGNDRCYYFLSGKSRCNFNSKPCVGYKICPNFKDMTVMEPEPVEEPKPQVNKRALFKGTAQQNLAEGSGTKEGKGTQGAVDGSPDGSPDGTGKNGSGGGFDLAGRSLIGSLPKPSYNAKAEGRVVVEIRVSSDGKVQSATYRSKGSTTQNTVLVRAAVEAARQARFNVDNSSPVQQGTITYIFKMQ